MALVHIGLTPEDFTRQAVKLPINMERICYSIPNTPVVLHYTIIVY